MTASFLYLTSFNYITNQPNHLINDSQIQKSNNREWISREDRSVLRVASSKVCYRHGLLDNFIDPSRHRTQYVYAISRGQHIRTMTGIERLQTCVRWGNALGFQPFRMELDPNTGKFRRFNFSWKHPQSFQSIKLLGIFRILLFISSQTSPSSYSGSFCDETEIYDLFPCYTFYSFRTSMVLYGTVIFPIGDPAYR